MFYSIFYFLMFSSSFICMQYINLYYKEIGLSSALITSIIIISSLLTIISSLVLGYIFDRTEKKHFIVYFLLVGSGVFFCSLAFFEDYKYILIFNTIFSLFYYSIQPLFVTITLENMKKNSKNYGKTRLFGTIGFCVTSLIIPMIKYKYTLFIAMFILVILMIIVFTIILKTEQINVPKQKKYKLNIKEIFENKKLIIYMLYVFVINITLGAYFNFFGIYYINVLGYTKNMFGILCAVATLSEIVFLVFSSKIIDKFSTRNILAFAGILTGIRWLLCSFFTSSVLLILVQVLNGAGFVVLATTINIYINENADEKNQATFQSFFFIGTLVFSKVFGSLFGGILPNYISQKSIFIVSFLICIISTILLLKFSEKENMSPSKEY